MKDGIKMKTPGIAIMSNLSFINDLVFQNVEGWVGDRIFQILEFVEELHTEMGVSGDVAEIGVHHGKMFFLIAALLRANEKAYAIDLFERQQLNIDRSGAGSRDVFSENQKKFFPELAGRIDVIAADSLSLSAGAACPLRTQIRLFSVDGGHTIDHVTNDLIIAQDVITPFGIVALDDFFGPHWPSVTEGYFRYIQYFNRRLAPFLIFQNKLFLTTVSEHEQILKKLRAFIEMRSGAEIHSRWKFSSLSGYKVLCFS